MTARDLFDELSADVAPPPAQPLRQSVRRSAAQSGNEWDVVAESPIQEATEKRDPQWDVVSETPNDLFDELKADVAAPDLFAELSADVEPQGQSQAPGWGRVVKSLPSQALESARLGAGGVMRSLTEQPPPEAVLTSLPARRIVVVDTPDGPKTVYDDSARRATLERHRATAEANRNPNDPISTVVRSVRDTGREMTTKARLRLAEATPENLTFWQGATVDAARSLGIAIPGLTLSVATGSPLPALATMGASEYGTSFDEALRSGLDESSAARFASINAGVEVLTEKIPLGTLLKRGTPFFQRLLKLYGQELVGENVATALQDANEFSTFNPNATMDDWIAGYGAKRLERAAKTSAATLLTTTVQGGGAHGAMVLTTRGERPSPSPPSVAPATAQTQSAVVEPAAQSSAVIASRQAEDVPDTRSTLPSKAEPSGQPVSLKGTEMVSPAPAAVETDVSRPLPTSTTSPSPASEGIRSFPPGTKLKRIDLPPLKRREPAAVADHSDDRKLLDNAQVEAAAAIKDLAKDLKDMVKDVRKVSAGSRPRTGDNNILDDANDDHSVGAAEAGPITPQSKLGQLLDSVKGGVKSVGKEIIDVTGGKSITYLDDLSKRSPTAKKLRDTMEYTEFSTEPIAPSFYERTSLKTGEYMTRLDSALDDLRGAFRRKIPEKVNDELLEALRGGKAKAPVAEVALRLRLLLNEARTYAQESGVEVGFVDNYVPRLYKKDLLHTDAGRDAFTRVLTKHGIDATTADSIAVKIANNDGILAVERDSSERVNPSKLDEAFDHGRVTRDHSPRRDKQLETARRLVDIPDSELAPFLESNTAALLRRYIEGIVRRAEYARAFGAGEGKLNQMVRDIITEASQSGRPVKPAEIRRIYDLADALQGQYRPILSNVGRGANQLVTSYQYIRTLPLATISSLSEPFLVIARGRPGTIPRAVARSLNHAVRETFRSVYRNIPKAEATKAIEDIGIGLDAALSERLTASFGGEVTKFTAAFFKLNFLHQWTRFTRVLANEAGKLMVERHLRDLVKGVSPSRTTQIRRELAELGVDHRAGMKWVQEGAPKDHTFTDTVKAAGLRFTNEVIMNPRPTVRPMWHSNPHYQTLAQLKGFQTVFGNTVLPRWYEMIAKRGAYEGVRNATMIATAGVLMVLTALLANDLRDFIKYGPGGNPRNIGEEPWTRIYRAVERVGFLGVFQFVSDALYANRFGSPAVAQIAGPTVGQANELIEAVGTLIDKGDSSALSRETANAIPVANVLPKLREEIKYLIEHGTGGRETRNKLDDVVSRHLTEVSTSRDSNEEKRAKVKKILEVRDQNLKLIGKKADHDREKN